MNKRIKAILLLFTFLFHIGLGTVCSMGLMRISEDAGVTDHSGLCHHNTTANTPNHPISFSDDNVNYLVDQHTDCCKDIVYKFEKLDKQVKGHVEWSSTVKEVPLIHYVSFAYLLLFNPTVTPSFVQDKVAWHPPLGADIRTVINSFQI